MHTISEMQEALKKTGEMNLFVGCLSTVILTHLLLIPIQLFIFWDVLCLRARDFNTDKKPPMKTVYDCCNALKHQKVSSNMEDQFIPHPDHTSFHCNKYYNTYNIYSVEPIVI